MKFEYPGKKMLELLSNPIVDSGLHGIYCRERYYASLFMLKLGVLSFSKNKRNLLDLILGTFSKVVKAATRELDDIRAIATANEERAVVYTDLEQRSSKLMREIKAYFRMDVAFEGRDQSEADELVNNFIKISQLSTYEYNKNRISEKLNIDLGNVDLFPRFPNLWLAFYFSEIIYLLLRGDFEARVDHGVILLAPHEEYKKTMKRSWLAETSEFNSNIADLFFLKSRDEFVRRSSITLENSEDIVEICLDKIFSLKTDMLSEELQKSQDLITLKEIVLFSACVECVSYTGNHIPESFFRKRTCIRDKTIDYLISILKLSGRSKSIASIDNFVFYENGFFKRGPQQFKFGIKKLAGRVLTEGFTELKDPKGDVGKSFEVDYVLNYLKSMDYFGYEAHGEFSPRSGAKTKGYDIDIVLKDKAQGVFFFIQVKYWFSNIPIYLDEKIKFFNDDKVQDAVVRQLVKLKESMNDNSIRDKLSMRGLGDANKDNSYFILLHNVPFLNFYEYSGVIFYEWNTLRNIIKNGMVSVNEYANDERKSTTYISASEKMPLHKPRELIEKYFGREDAYGYSINANWYLYKNSWSLINLNGIDFMVQAF